MSPTRPTDPETIPRRLALYPADGEFRTEVWACRRRWNFGRFDFWIEPARGRGGKWARADRLEFLEDEPPEHGGRHE